ncbi:sodium:solute symporter [Echinicola vietnamensis]|uniref:SSS sodium solute transporter n=1 Tax=Echinicola vietnamensis (strain DSM 17526 / LMG 23754 / KMM 6221) TaxID=926556 RepID=L0FVY7_ECHVK|nr:sodium:solute symporter [Echinicola vietnamensis]AGA77198.1 SSS sodium solute transporter [Echinicola vietnamensis DSM 17526]
MDASLHWIDYLLIVVSILGTIYMGIYFSKRQKSSEDYFAGGGGIPSWAIGMSIFATLISSVTFLAYPSAAYKSNWILLVQGLMVPIVLVCMIWVIVPLFRRVIGLSTYEYFEKRFGFFARLYSSLAFVLTHFSKMGTVLYLVSLALSSMMDVNIFMVIGVLTFVIIVLTLLGGIEAVIWMDVIQGFLLIGGGLFCLGLLLFVPEGGPERVMEEAISMKKIGFGPYDIDFTQLTFIVMVVNGIFYAIQKYGTDQTIVQRYLTARNDREAKKAAYMGVFLSVPVWALFMLIGSLLFVFYQISGSVLPEGTSVDAVFPYFIMTELPPGVTGLVLAALAAAAISSLDSDMNCLAAVGVEDYYKRFNPNCNTHQKLKVGRILVLISGLAAAGVAVLYVLWQGEGVLGAVFGLYAIFSAGIVGIFLLGLFSRRANKEGLYVGIVACILFTAYALLTSTPMSFGGGEKTLLLDLGKFNFNQHKYMLGVYSHLIVLIVGYIASLFFKRPPADENLTIYGYFKQKQKMERAKEVV